MTGPTPTDELIKLARAGDRMAWGALAQRYGQRVRVALLADGLSLDASKDLAQEAWACIWSKQQMGELVELQLPGLVIAQARFLAKNLRRRERRAAAVVEPEPDLAPAAEGLFSARQAVHRVRQLLGSRSALQQRIFWAAIEHQQSHADIATTEGLSLQRVRQIIWEVRCVLRAAVEPVSEPP